MITFDLHLGIDYSGRDTSETRTSALQVYAADRSANPEFVRPPAGKNWCRREIAEYLIAQVQRGVRFVCGIDHAFSFPLGYFQNYQIASWPEFLDDFCHHWPTDAEGVTVEQLRQARPLRVGSPRDYRLTELWTSSAKSVFLFDVQGSVAKSTHAGLPWLRRVRQAVGQRLHVWPFDGWVVPPGRSVVMEVYPSLVRNRYPRDGRTPDQQDAYAVARWLAEIDRDQFFLRYCEPPLTSEQRQIVEREGWIFGVC